MNEKRVENVNRSLSAYQSLCTEYYDLDKPNAPEDALTFYLEYARKSNGPILEPMCGSGRFLLPMTEMNFDLKGFDASPFMLEALRNKAKKRSIYPQVRQGFFQDLDTMDRYGLIFIPAASFCLITDIEEAKACLKKIYSLLSEKGTFVFEAETIHAIPKSFHVWKGSVQEKEDGKFILLNTLDLPVSDNIGTTICRYELIDGHSIIKTEMERFCLRFYEPEKLYAILKEIGFNNINLIKAFDRYKSPGVQDEVLVYECTK